MRREIGPPIPGASFTVIDAGTVTFLKANADARGEAVWEKPLQLSSEATNGVEGKIPSRLPRALPSGLRTRRYHGLLICVDPTTGRRQLGLASLEAVLCVGDRRIQLATEDVFANHEFRNTKRASLITP